jgi:hypothetical protein
VFCMGLEQTAVTCISLHSINVLLFISEASPDLNRKSIKNVGFKRHQIISLTGASTYLGPALVAGL